MHPESVQSLCNPWYVRNSMSSSTKVLLFQLKSLLIGSLHLPYSWKVNGKPQVCLDPKDLNAAIRHDHYKTPAVTEITHELAGSTCFNKLDGTSSYLCIFLNYEPSLLTTFSTPWGRFRFVCLSWVLACTQDIFQQMMDQILTYCDGVIGITYDEVVHGNHESCP